MNGGREPSGRKEHHQQYRDSDRLTPYLSDNDSSSRKRRKLNDKQHDDTQIDTQGEHKDRRREYRSTRDDGDEQDRRKRTFEERGHEERSHRKVKRSERHYDGERRHDEQRDRKDRPKRTNRSRSRDRHKGSYSRSRSRTRSTSPRSRTHHKSSRDRRRSWSPRKSTQKRVVSTSVGRDTKGEKHSKRASPPPDSDSDPLEAIVGPLPPAPKPAVRARGRGALKANSVGMDARFSSTYDASADVRLNSDIEDEWGDALEALKDRQTWMSRRAERLRDAGFSNEVVKRWEKGDSMGEEDVVWASKGQNREWDRGKVVADNGDVELKAEWGRLK
jgi:hypothetical protein